MSEYITTHARLQEVALQKLGEMKPGTTYAQYMSQARAIAAEQGVSRPTLMLAMKYKPTMNTAQLQVVSADGQATDVSLERGSTEAVYPIADFEWDAFVADIPTYLVENPTVWVVDGDKFTAPI